MKNPVSIHSPGQLTVLAALLAGLCAPASASDVVISQVYGGGGNNGATYTNDFIELFNSGTGAVSLSGMSVQYASAGGSSWAVTALPAVTLQPGQYFLVSENSNAAVGTPLPTADASANIAMAAGAGKVLLSSVITPATGTAPTVNVLDMVGYGTITGGTENPAAGTLSATTSARRKLSCTDTNNNGGDFAVGAPTPRNSGTALAPCGGGATNPIVATCPTPLSLAFGSAGSAALSAIDFDDVVSGASITSSPVAGITLGSFATGAAANTASTVPLNVSASVPVGSYPVAIRFSNAKLEQTSCTVAVNVQGESAVTFRIPEIQGAGDTAAHLGVQTTEGVVTAKVGSGFFMQDEAGDGNPLTSDGIFVFGTAGAASVAVGDLVRVTATVIEFTPPGATRSYTEMTSPTSVTVKASRRSITPTNIDLPFDNLGQVEGMLVRFAHPLTLSQSEYLGTRGELTLSSGRLEVPTSRYPARSAEAIALAAANAKNVIVLDDGIFVTPTTIPYIAADKTIRAGDTVSDLTGVVDFGAIGGGGAAFKLQPTVLPVVFSRDNARPAAPGFAAQGNVKVASANVLNFFTTFTNGNTVFGTTGQGCQLGSSNTRSNCRGADNIAEFDRQRDKIVNALKLIDADVFGLMEIQNNGETTVSYLVDSLNTAIGATVYALVPKPADTGTDAIRVAMIYKPAKLTLIGGALSDSNTVHNRPPMAATFKAANGGKFSLIVNHFKSKGGCPSGTGDNADHDGQGCWNATRVAQATRVRDSFVGTVAASAGDPDVLVIGDLNAHGFEDPIKVFTDGGFVNQLERYVRPTGMPYSFIFNGESGYLDHALASASLSSQVSGSSEFHNNADEPTVIDYNLDGKPQDLYVNNAYRASDHDPVIITLDLAPTFVDVTGSFTVVRSGVVLNRATGQYTSTYSFTNKTGAAINGPFQVELAGLPSGVTLANASGSHGGVPYITAGAASIAPGATVSVQTNFINPGKVGIGYTATIYSGTF